MNRNFWLSIGLCFTGVLAVYAENSREIGHLIASDLQAGKYAEARELLDSALKKFPGDARLWTLNGLALVRSGKQREALASYNKALQISPDYIPALESAAEVKYETGDPGVVPVLRHILEIRPGDKTSHGMLAAIAFKDGDCEAAKSEYGLSQPAGSTPVPALEEFGACLVKQKRTIEAIPVFERLSEIQHESRHALYSLAVVQFLTGHYRDVIATLSRAPNTEPPDGDTLELMGEAYEASSDTPEALDALRRAILSQPGVPRYYVDFANVCLAHAFFQVGIDILNEGLARMPDTATLYITRGLLLSELAQHEKAEADFDKAERLDPNVEFGSAVRGLVELMQNNLGQAETTIRERLQAHREDGFLYYLLAEVLIRKGAAAGTPALEEAVKAAARAVELQPNLTVARDALARLYQDQGRTEESIEQSRLALRNDPADKTAIYHLIVALRKARRTEEIPALMKRLVALREQGQKQEAVERHETALEKVQGSQPPPSVAHPMGVQ